MSRRAYFTNKGQTAAVVVGQSATIDLDNRMQTRKLNLILEGTVTTSVAATALRRNRGLLSSAFQFSVLENGSQEWGLPIEGRMARMLAESLSAAPLPATVLPTGALPIAAYNLREVIPIWFANPLGVSPRETNYMERNPNARFQLQAFVKANALASLVEVSTATVVLSNLRVTVEQDADPSEPSLPIFKPRYREITQNVTAANAQDILRVDTPFRIQQMILSAEADVSGGGTVEVADVINGFQLLGDSGRYLVGPNDAPFRAFVEQSAEWAGGDTLGALAYGVMNFQRSGRLSDVPFPSREFANFRFQINSQPSVIAGVTATRYRLGIIELTRPDPVGDWRTVAAELPEYVKL